MPAPGLIAVDPVWCERLFTDLLAFSRDEPGVTRAAYGEGEERAHAAMRAAGLELGLQPATDAAGNLFLTMAGRDPDLPAWMIGSHVDTVTHGGNYDGAAGVIGGLAAVAALKRAGIVPRRPITVAIFRAEESTWFPTSYIGSRAALGLLPPEALELRRSDSGRTLRDHMAALDLDPAALARREALLRPEQIHGFVEIHIEQGPTLDAAGLPLGLVTGISGSVQYRAVRCFGAYGHSGAVERSHRHDAVFALADLVTGLDTLCGAIECAGGRATVTVGEVSTDPALHAFAKIPGEVRFCLDIRSADLSLLARIEGEFLRIVARIEEARGVRFALGERTGSSPATMNEALVDALSSRADALDIPCRRMPSGAGHDTAVFAQAGVPAAMVFVRNQNGSHNPDEAMRIGDLCVAATLVAHLVAEDIEDE